MVIAGKVYERYPHLLALMSACLSHCQIRKKGPTALKAGERHGVYLAELASKPSNDAMLSHDRPCFSPKQ